MLSIVGEGRVSLELPHAGNRNIEQTKNTTKEIKVTLLNIYMYSSFFKISFPLLLRILFFADSVHNEPSDFGCANRSFLVLTLDWDNAVGPDP